MVIQAKSQLMKLQSCSHKLREQIEKLGLPKEILKGYNRTMNLFTDDYAKQRSRSMSFLYTLKYGC